MKLDKLTIPELMDNIKSQVKGMTYTNLILSRAMVDSTYTPTPVVKEILAFMDAEIAVRNYEALKEL